MITVVVLLFVAAAVYVITTSPKAKQRFNQLNNGAQFYVGTLTHG